MENNRDKIKELGLKALLEKGNVKDFFDVQLKENDNQAKGQLIGSIARIADMVTQHADGVFVEEISSRLSDKLNELAEQLAKGLSKDLEGAENDLRKLVEETDSEARAEILTTLSEKVQTAQNNIDASMARQIRAALPELAEEARLSEDEKQELVDFASLSVESQMSELIGAYFADNALDISEIQGFRDAVQAIVSEQDLSGLEVDFERVKNIPSVLDKFIKTGGKTQLKFMADVANIDSITNGQALIYNTTTKNFEPGDAGGDVEGTEVLSTGETGGSKFLREDGDGTCSWVAIPGGGDALTASPLSQFAATTSAQLAGVISDETGTGGLVFANSPTLVTPALGTPSALVLTNATGLPVAQVTQHEASLTITESQISDLGAYLTDITGEALSTLSDVTITTIASGELLKWNGSAWVNNTLAEAGIAATSHTHTLSDVTDSGALAALATVDTAQIDDEAVTLAKMAHVATNRILGRSTAGTGDVEALTAVQAADTIGVGTGDSPQFTGVNVGHATDTTITRVSAGVIAVEGSNVQLEPSEGGFANGDKTKLDGIEASADVTDTTNVTAAGALMDSELTDIAAIKAASDASVAVTDTGTSTSAFVTPDGLAGSYAGTKSVVIQAEDMATDLAVGDDLATFYIPEAVGGMNLVGIHAYVDAAGTTGTTDIQIHNETQTADMLTTKVTIDSAETSSRTAATAAVIDTANDDVAAGDKLRIDVDAISSTAPKGLFVELEFRLP